MRRARLPPKAFGLPEKARTEQARKDERDYPTSSVKEEAHHAESSWSRSCLRLVSSPSAVSAALGAAKGTDRPWKASGSGTGIMTLGTPSTIATDSTLQAAHLGRSTFHNDQVCAPAGGANGTSNMTIVAARRHFDSFRGHRGRCEQRNHHRRYRPFRWSQRVVYRRRHQPRSPFPNPTRRAFPHHVYADGNDLLIGQRPTNAHLA
jgi:hypothetical protein